MIEQLKKDVANKLKDHPKRYEHSVGVVKTAISLALRYGVDSNKAYIAAIFHDYTKYDTLTFQTRWPTRSIPKTSRSGLVPS